MIRSLTWGSAGICTLAFCFFLCGIAQVACAEVSSSRELEDWTMGVHPENMIKLPSQWQEYFGVHYMTADAQDSLLWKTVRGYGGPHVGLPIKGVPTGEGEPVRIGPFTGSEIRVSLRDIRRHRNPNSRSIDLLVPEIIQNDLTAIYIMTSVIHPSMGLFNKDMAYWALRLLYERFPDADKHVYWQIGNEVNGLHFDPKGLKEKIEATGESRWKYFNTKEQQDLYVEGYLAPAIESIYRVSQDVYGDPHRIKILLGSAANSYNPNSIQWICDVMDRNIVGTQAPSLVGDPVWKHIDILTIHYPFARGNGGEVAQEVYERYMQTGKVEGIWITEEHGRQGKGPVTIADRSLQFIHWIAKNHLNAEQTRLVWWGTGIEKPAGKPIEAVQILGKILSHLPLWVAMEKRGDARIYVMVNEADQTIDRLTIVIVPDASSEISLGDLTLSLPEGGSPETWMVQATQFSSEEPPVGWNPETSWEESRLTINIGKQVAEPLILYLSCQANLNSSGGSTGF